MHTTHTKIILGAHRGKDGKYPVQLRVTYVYARPINVKYKGRKVRMTKEEFAATQKQRFTKTEQAAREWSRIFAEIERHAEEIIESMEVFSFALFKEQFQGVKGDRENVYHWYREKIRTTKNPATAEGYKNSMAFVKQMSGRPANLLLQEITPKVLERWTRKAAPMYSQSTISKYLRELRHIFNMAMADGVIDQKVYPFRSGSADRKKHKIAKWETKHAYLKPEAIKVLFDYQPADDLERWARDMWKFIFSSNGINMADIARLTWQDVKDDHIIFTRKKTAETSGQETTIPLTETNARIIERWGKPAKEYVFPILKKGMSEEQQRRAWKQATKRVNKYLQRIQAKTGIQVEGGDRLTTYTARHSLSELLFSRGVNDLLIADMLGHSSAKTARDNYRSRSSIEAQRRAIEDILPPGESSSDL